MCNEKFGSRHSQYSVIFFKKIYFSWSLREAMKWHWTNKEKMTLDLPLERETHVSCIKVR